MSAWNILYRGSLSSCNYACAYCPFAKSAVTRSELCQDEEELARFVAWVAVQRRRLGILLTPRGEALIHPYYRRALTRLSGLSQVDRISIQTNLSAPLAEVAGANRETLAFWTTFHPAQTSLTRFVARCRELDAMGFRYSVGVVGVHEHFDLIEALRRRLRPEVYLWINAFKRTPGYYTPDDIDRLHAVDPYFHWNLQAPASAGDPCSAGETAFTVDGVGDVRRCHFVAQIIGNIYESGFSDCLKPRACSTAACDCYLGYIHRSALKLRELYGVGLLERIPMRWPEVIPAFDHPATMAETHAGSFPAPRT